MQYSSYPILTDTTDAIVVPCRMSGTILGGTTQEEVAEKYKDEYVRELAEDVVSELMEVGTPGLFQKEGGVMILNVPVYDKLGKEITDAMLMSTLQEVVLFVAMTNKNKKISIGPMGRNISWDTVETMCSLLEERHDGEVEFIFHPPQEDEEDEEPEWVNTSLPANDAEYAL